MPKNQLTAADVEQLRKAREAQHQAKMVGVDVTEKIDQQSTAQPSTSYETFIPIEGLPSGGMFYQNTLMGQPLKVEDLLLIQTINGRNLYKVFTELFSRRIKGVDAHDILVCDEIYILLWLRANSYPGYNFPHDGFTCSNFECGIDVPSTAVEFGFDEMDFDSPKLKDVLAKFGGQNSTTITLKSGRELTLYMKRRKHLARVDRIVDRDYTAYGNAPSDELVQLLNIASTITFSEGMDLMDVVSVLRKLTAVEFTDLLNQIKKYTISGDPTIQLKCPACGEVTRFNGYTFQPSVFIPVDD